MNILFIIEVKIVVGSLSGHIGPPNYIDYWA